MAKVVQFHKLTLKQEAFCQAFLYGPEGVRGNQSGAYRSAYQPNYDNEALWVNACKLMSSAKVKQRIEELKEQDRQEAGLTLDGLLAELEEARALALEWKQGGPAIQATMGRAKLGGFIVEKQQVDQTIVDAREQKPEQFNDALDKAKAS